MTYPIARRIDRTVAMAGASTIDLFRTVPAFPRKTPAISPLDGVYRGACWDFGGDSKSLESLTSGHKGAISSVSGGAMTYASGYITTPSDVAGSGADLGIKGSQTASWWIAAQYHSDRGGELIGNSWNSSETSGWQLRFNNNSPYSVYLTGRGSTGLTTLLNVFSGAGGALANGDWILIGVMMDGAAIEGFIYGGGASRVSSTPHTPNTSRNIGIGSLLVPAGQTAYLRGQNIADVGHIKGVRLTRTQMEAIMAQRVTALAAKSITVRTS